MHSLQWCIEGMRNTGSLRIGLTDFLWLEFWALFLDDLFISIVGRLATHHSDYPALDICGTIEQTVKAL